LENHERDQPSVLVVDDCQDSADGLSWILTTYGYDVHVAYNANDALAHAQTHSPDIVLLDLALPDKDGYEVADELKRNDHAPVLVAVTGYGRPQDKQHCAEAGFSHHLTKPVDPKVLLDTLDKVSTQ